MALSVACTLVGFGRVSMRRLLCLMLISLLGVPLAHAGVVIWLEDELPDEKVLKRSDTRTGGTGHLASSYLAYPPSPVDDADQDSYELLRVAMDEANRRWEEFEIEYAIATGFEQVIDGVGVVRDERDRDAVVSALLFQGAATHIAFEGDGLKVDERAEPFRLASSGKVINLPWTRALAMDSHRIFRRSDLADGASFPALQSAQSDIDTLPLGRIILPPLMAGERVVWNGVMQESAVRELTVHPGRHWVHLMRDDVVHGRAVLDVAPLDEVTFPSAVSAEEMETARAKYSAAQPLVSRSHSSGCCPRSPGARGRLFTSLPTKTIRSRYYRIRAGRPWLSSNWLPW